MTKRNTWVDVDLDGLRQIIAHRGKAWFIYELIQNAWDEPGVNRVELRVEAIGHGLRRITITDNSANGFADIRDAFTMFAPSKKKGDARKRGRFNVGEKFVLAMCESAEIVSTQSAVVFDERGRRMSRKRREAGTQFTAEVKFSAADVDELRRGFDLLVPPDGIHTEGVFEDALPVILERLPPVRQFEETLPTVIADDDGNLKRSRRKTRVTLLDPKSEVPMLCEMGIPVVEVDYPWTVDVDQRVPLSTDRDNVSPAYLRELQTALLNNAVDLLAAEDAAEAWVVDATGDDEVSAEAFDAAMDKRFGDKRVARDMHDPEANARAVANGYVLVEPRSLTRDQWRQNREHGSVVPAGRVFPTAKVGTSPDGVPSLALDTEELIGLDRWVRDVAERLEISLTDVQLYKSRTLGFAGAFGRERRGCGDLSLNLAKSWWRELRQGDPEAALALLIHEFAHAYESNHLSDAFHKALSRLGAKLALAGVPACEVATS